MRCYEKRIAPRSEHPLWVKMRRTVCMLLAFLTVVVALILLVQLILPQLVECFDKLIAALVEGVPALYAWLDEKLSIGAFLQEQNIPTALPQTTAEWRTLLEEYAHVLLTGVGGVMNLAVTVTTSLFGTIVTLFMSLIFACNILGGKEKLASQFNRLFTRILGEKIMAGVRHVLHVLDSCFSAYIVGQLIEALILGSLCAVGMWIFQLPYPIMIGALIGVLALIPIAGAYIGGALGAIMIFSVDPFKALFFIVFLIVLQQIEGNLIYPRTVGSTLHLPGIWVLAAVTIGGAILGIAGMAGSGQRELLEAIAGLQHINEGEITYNDPKTGKTENLRDKTPLQIRELGVRLSFVPEDRLGMGLVGNMDIVDNMMLRSYRKGKGIFLHRKEPRDLAEHIIADLEVATPSASTPVRRLSGGNVQKVLVGREIAAAPTVLMAAYPVRGLDINSSYTIYNLLNQQKERGVAVIFVGEDLDVLVELCDRILVIGSGKITGVVDARNTTKEQIGLLMTKTEVEKDGK